MKKFILFVLFFVMFASIITLNIIIIRQQERINNITRELEIVDIIKTEKGLLVQIEIENID